MPQTVANDLPLSALCYLEASKLDSPAGALSELALVTNDVRSTGWRRRHYLVKADQLAQIDSQKGVLRLLCTDIAEVYDFDAEGLHRFSDADLLAAVFSSRGA